MAECEIQRKGKVGTGAWKAAAAIAVHCPPSDRARRKSAGHLQNRAPGRSFIMQHRLIVSVAEYNRLDIIRLSRYDQKASWYGDCLLEFL